MTEGEFVVAACARSFGIKVADILGHSRSQTNALARKAAAWLLRTHVGMSYPEIARELGYADHTSPMAAYDSAKRLLVRCVDCQCPPYKHRQAEHFTRRVAAAEADLIVTT